MKRVIIMIGLPGSGKSTRVKELTDGLPDGETFKVHSTDTYHMVDGKYSFQPTKLGYFHRLNYEAFCESVDNKFDCVIVDNTNIRSRDRKQYVQYAKDNGYKVDYEIIGEFDEDFVDICAARNTHGVPREAIARMAKRIQLPNVLDTP